MRKRGNPACFTLWYLRADLKAHPFCPAAPLAALAQPFGLCLLCNTDSDLGCCRRVMGEGNGATNKPEKHWNFRFSTQTHEQQSVSASHPQGKAAAATASTSASPWIPGFPMGMTLKRDASTPWISLCHPKVAEVMPPGYECFVSLGWCNLSDAGWKMCPAGELNSWRVLWPLGNEEEAL